LQFAIYKNGQIIAILQISIYKNGHIIAILQMIKIPSIGNFCKFIKNGQLLQFTKLQFIKTAKMQQHIFCTYGQVLFGQFKPAVHSVICTQSWFLNQIRTYPDPKA
jgi:hypothetical protein